MIRDAVLHIHNEQPLMADLFEMPDATTTLLRCTNLRDLNGKRPVYADDIASVFYFPIHHLRFIEVLPRSLAGDRLALPSGEEAEPIVMGGGNGAAGEPDDDLDGELEIDEDFLRRIREA